MLKKKMKMIKMNQTKDDKTEDQLAAEAEERRRKEQIETEEAELKGDILLKDYAKIEKQYVICLDTLGQDREFTDNEKEFIFKTTMLIKKSWEDQETKFLLKNRDLRLK